MQLWSLPTLSPGSRFAGSPPSAAERVRALPKVKRQDTSLGLGNEQVSRRVKNQPDYGPLPLGLRMSTFFAGQGMLGAGHAKSSPKGADHTSPAKRSGSASFAYFRLARISPLSLGGEHGERYEPGEEVQSAIFAYLRTAPRNREECPSPPWGRRWSLSAGPGEVVFIVPLLAAGQELVPGDCSSRTHSKHKRDCRTTAAVFVPARPGKPMIVTPPPPVAS